MLTCLSLLACLLTYISLLTYLPTGSLPTYLQYSQCLTGTETKCADGRSAVTDLKEIEAEAAAWLEEGAHATDDISQLLATHDGGPGKSAAQYSHFWMLRKVQRGYACFDAYARISLTVSAQQLLLVGAYYAIALFMTKTEGWPEPSQNPATGWLSSATAAFAGCILYKLDRGPRSQCFIGFHSFSMLFG